MAQFVFGQTKPAALPKTDVMINISALSTVAINGEYHINIHKTKKQIKVIYSFLDSIASSKLRKDKNYINTKKYYKSISNKQQGLANDSVQRYYSMLGDVLNKYKVYTKDSITLKLTTDTSYDNLINSIISTSKEQLENLEVSKKRTFLDGISFTFKITANGTTRTVYADTPDKMSHPQLYRLIKESMAVYRNRNNNDFLNLKRTSGY